jgi:sugar phosphate isomerase/epimerase
MKFGVADYGMSVWDGGTFDTEARWRDVLTIGYQGVERLYAVSAEDALHKAARMRRLGIDYGTCLGPNPETSIQWTAALGKSYVWTAVTGKDFDSYCRQVNGQAEAAARWGISVGVHNHLGQPVESQVRLEEFLARCPQAGVILDTAHLAAAGGDAVAIVRRYPTRLIAVHLKDWLELHPEIGLDRWWERGRFCELGAGNIGVDNAGVMRALVEVAYDGWVFVEHDTHLQDPRTDLAISRAYLQELGF